VVAADTPPPEHGRSGRSPLLPGLLCLLVTAAVAAGCAVAFGPDRPGWPGAIAFAAAATVPGATAAWILAHLRSHDPAPGVAVATSLAGTTLRIMPPLAALAWLSSRTGGQPDPAAAPLLLGFYLALLAADILLHIMVGMSAAGAGRRPD